MNWSVFKRPIGLLAIGAVCLALAACALFPSVSDDGREVVVSPALREAIQDADNDLSKVSTQVAAETAAAQASGDAKRIEEAAKAQKALDQVNAGLAAGKSVLVVNEQGNLDIADTATRIGALLPSPFNWLVPAIGLLVPIGLRELSQHRQKVALKTTVEKEQAASASIIKSIDVLKLKDPAVMTAFKNVDGNAKAAARMVLTPEAEDKIYTISST